MHCVHSWYAERVLSGNVRASFYLYNTVRDADALVAGVRELLDRVPPSTEAPGVVAGPGSPRPAPG
jgi:hypothetical protein